jgi:hypothetical protein
MAGFHALAISLRLPIWRFWSAKSPKVSTRLRNYPRFGKLRPETWFDHHCRLKAGVEFVH